MAGCQNVGSWVRSHYPIYIGALHKYLVGLSYLHFNKIQDKLSFVWQVQCRGLFLLASPLSVLSLLSLPLTSSRLSHFCLCDLKYPWLGWPTSWLAGWLASWLGGCASGGWRWSLHVGCVGRWLSKGSRFNFCWREASAVLAQNSDCMSPFWPHSVPNWQTHGSIGAALILKTKMAAKHNHNERFQKRFSKLICAC